MTTISNCGKDERGKYSGGKAGDQGGEWVLRPWYNRPWDCVLRHPEAKVRKMIASMAKAAAENDKVGYDQEQRETFWEQLKKARYKPEDIKTTCEADCSSGVAAIVKGAGYRLNDAKMKAVPTDLYTGNEKHYLTKAGFVAYTDKQYTAHDDYLLAGDILLNESHHTAINVTDGAKATPNITGGKSGKTTEEIAREVIDGKWGNGDYRRKKLKNAGYDPDKVQAKVNSLTQGEKAAKPKTGALKVGSKVKVKSVAHIYGTTKLFASFVYKNVYKVVEVKGNRVVIADNDGVIGAVAKSDCTVQ